MNLCKHFNDFNTVKYTDVDVNFDVVAEGDPHIYCGLTDHTRYLVQTLTSNDGVARVDLLANLFLTNLSKSK